MKTVAILLVVGIAGYAIYDLFKGSAGASLFGTPGQITPSGVSVPGVPAYSNVAAPSNFAGTVTAAATLATEFAPAFGPGGNDVSSDEFDSDSLSGQFSSLGY